MLIRLTLAVIAAIALGGCDPQGAPLTAAAPGEAAPAPAPAAFSATAPSGAPRPGVYRVAPGDTIEVTVFQVPDLNRTLEIDGSGQINLPLLGAVPAAGKTVRELERDIAQRLGARYLQSPQVAVNLKEAVGARVTVDGAVKAPGVVQAKGEMTLLRAIAQTGGFAETADQSGVMIFRQTAQGRTAARFDVNAIRSGQAQDPPVYGGDTIVVDEHGGKLAWKQFREALPVAGLFRVF